ncbi:hypothetical protein FP026_08345 [Rhizobium tropici]|uniref:Uncharacterized protein n=1 Tax=Rhizobium tropici TaxID=398 RepID=A0A5B0W8E8_RHITR|nr:hypothetical protein FP026_08345 [Rhizobium tropici]
MQAIDQTLEDVVASLSPLDVDWMDDTARNNAMSAQLNAQHQIAKYSTLQGTRFAVRGALPRSGCGGALDAD